MVSGGQWRLLPGVGGSSAVSSVSKGPGPGLYMYRLQGGGLDRLESTLPSDKQTTET